MLIIKQIKFDFSTGVSWSDRGRIWRLRGWGLTGKSTGAPTSRPSLGVCVRLKGACQEITGERLTEYLLDLRLRSDENLKGFSKLG